MDFTIRIYKRLLDVLIGAGYNFQSFTEFLEKPEDRVIMLRHDVDDKKQNSLHFAQLQHKSGIKGTYYFRMVPQSFDEEVVKRIADCGHEIGYHYEDLDLVSSKFEVRNSKLREEDLYDYAIESFQSNLEKLKKIYPVKTICMHGSPRSKFDNKSIWTKFDYRDFDIIGEPYFDLDFNEVLYLTDTGRRWDGDKVSIRDKVMIQESRIKSQESKAKSHKLSFHSTHQIIAAAENDELPDRIMFTFHPQRWTNNPLSWLWELVFQNVKNQVKGHLVKRSKKQNNIIDS